MFSKRAHRTWISLFILAVAVILRLDGIAYGIGESCLAMAQEAWMREPFQSTSLYALDARAQVNVGYLQNPLLPITGAYQPQIINFATDPRDVLILRLISVFAGIVTTALILRLGQWLHLNWWPVAGLIAAALPPLVEANRWVERFNFAPLFVVTSIFLLVIA